MTQEKFLKRYEKYNEKTQEYMKMFGAALMLKYQEIPDVYVVSLDMLAGNLEIMTKSMDDITSGAADIVGKDEYRGEKKSTQLTAFLASQTNVSKIVDKFGFTPMSKSKIRDNQDAGDVAKYLESLMK